MHVVSELSLYLYNIRLSRPLRPGSRRLHGDNLCLHGTKHAVDA